jgi:hypothetical protein
MGLRKRVVKFIKTGGSKAGAARRFDLGRSTVYRHLDVGKQECRPPKRAGDIGENSTRSNPMFTPKNIPTPRSRNSKRCLASAIMRSGCGGNSRASR